MAKKMVAPRPPQAKGRKPLTLADVRVTHTVGSKVTVRTGETLTRLIEATRHLHDDSDTDLDFINPDAIALELIGVAEVLTELNEDARISALSYLSEQLRRLSNRVAALGPQAGNSAPAWYKVEVTR